MTLFLTDIASYQAGLNLATDLAIAGVFVKATEGLGYVDPDYAGWLTQAKATGLLFAAYHYVTQDDPAVQAQWIAKNIIDKNIPLMLDVEIGVNVPWLVAFVNETKAVGLNPKVVYLPKWYWQRLGQPDLTPLGNDLALTSSEYPTTASGSAASLYPGDNADGWKPYGGVTPTFYQFTDAALLGGQKVDMNAYRGSLGQLAELFGAQLNDAPAYTGPLGYNPGKAMLHTPGVLAWQRQMQKRGWSITADGWYGAQSKSVCEAFQGDSTAHGWPLAVDGIVGPLTWKATWLRPVTK